MGQGGGNEGQRVGKEGIRGENEGQRGGNEGKIRVADPVPVISGYYFLYTEICAYFQHI